MKRVGIFLGVEPSNGGMFQYALSILESLDRLRDDGFEIKVVYVDELWKPILDNFRFEAIREFGSYFGLRLAEAFMVARIPGGIARCVASKINPISRTIKRQACDIWIFPAQDALSYQVDVPVAATVHDLMHRYESEFPEVSHRQRYRLREHRFKNLTAWATAVLVDSKIGKEHVINSYATPPDKVYPLPYVAPSYIREVQSAADFESHYRLPAKFLFYPAQFWAHKNHRRLITAASLALERCPDLFLVFSGSKRHSYAQIYEHARMLGFLQRISFVGFIPDRYLSGFYRRARALIMPTFFGPTNIPPLEAFATGCPCAISDIYGMRQQAAGAAILFDPKSTNDIAAAIERLWLDDVLCANLCERGLQVAESWGLPQFSARLRQILDAIS